MPDKPSYFDKIPSALQKLTEIADEHLKREMVEVLLEVKRRRAQQIMDLIGPMKLNKEVVVRRDDFIRYLELQGGAEYQKAEKERRKRLAEVLRKLDEERKEEPPLYVEVKREEVKAARKKGIGMLPPGMVSPGRIVIECETAVGAIEYLKLICIVLGFDLEGFTEVFESKQKSLCLERSGDMASQRTGGALASPESAA